MKVGIICEGWRLVHEALTERGVDNVLVEPDASRRHYEPEALARLADVDAILSGTYPLPEAVLDAAPNCRMIQTYGVGYNHVALAEATRRGIVVCNNAGVNKEAVAETNMMHLLAHAKRLYDHHALVAKADWSERGATVAHSFELAGRTLGIVGLGNTGYELAIRARAFGMELLYNDIREIEPERVEASGARFAEKDELFQTADAVAICTDLNDESRGMVDARRIGMMKPTAILLCCARGGIVDEAALRDALNAGRLAGAGMDVFETEPNPAENPLLQARNVTLTPHIAGVNPQTYDRVITWSIENIRRLVERDERPLRVVNGL